MSAYQQKTSPALLLHFIRAYPMRFLIVFCALLLAGFIETIGIGALLPLLNLVLDIGGSDDSNVLSRAVNAFFHTIGIEQSFENLLLVIISAIVIKAGILFQALKIVSYIAVDITYDLRQQFIRSLIYAQWRYYSALNAGRSANAIATEADYAGQFCVIMGKTLSSAIQVAIYTAIAFAIDWRVSLAAIAIGAIAAFILKFLIQMARDAGNDLASVLNRLLSRLTEALSGAKPIKAMGEEERYVTMLHHDTVELQVSRKRLSLSSLLLNLVHEPLLVLLMAAGLFWAYRFSSFPMSELLMMAFLFNRLLSQVNMVQNNYQKTAIFEGAVNAILEKTAEATSVQEQNQGHQQASLKQAITLKNLSISYDDTAVLRAFNGSIPAHKMTAVFGPSGSGKSTLLDALLGLVPYQKGRITIDNTPLTEIDINAWRRSIGYVPQETFLFHDTIAKNVSLGDTRFSEQDIVAALTLADAWPFVRKLDTGIHHMVGERGGKLSGGQKQRIALARALIRKPSLLILDEATTGLDKKSENAILAALKKMLPEMTVVLISHDPHILDVVDHAVRLDKGTS